MFVLFLPQVYTPGRPARRSPVLPPATDLPNVLASPDSTQIRPQPEPVPTNQFLDDLGDIQPGDKVLLIVENDNNFAHFLFDRAHERGFKAVVTGRGASAIQRARELQPTAITLDINLPD